MNRASARKILSIRTLGLVTLACATMTAYAALRLHFSDKEVVSRAELIVVGRVQQGSVVLIGDLERTNLPPDERDAPSTEYHSPPWEHQMELLVSEVLKGRLADTSAVVSVGYGLEPLVGGCLSNEFRVFDFRGTNYPKDMVQIFDVGSIKPPPAATGDIRTNHIWLLRKKSPSARHSHNESPQATLGIYDPEDNQPIAKKGELMMYLRESPPRKP